MQGDFRLRKRAYRTAHTNVDGPNALRQSASLRCWPWGNKPQTQHGIPIFPISWQETNIIRGTGVSTSKMNIAVIDTNQECELPPLKATQMAKGFAPVICWLKKCRSQVLTAMVLSCMVREMGSSNAMPKRPTCDQAVSAAAVELFQSCEPADVHVVNSKTLCVHEQCDSSHDGWKFETSPTNFCVSSKWYKKQTYK